MGGMNVGHLNKAGWGHGGEAEKAMREGRSVSCATGRRCGREVGRRAARMPVPSLCEQSSLHAFAIPLWSEQSSREEGGAVHVSPAPS
eukprot:364278-Chlamydomonas_euryale.AAC.7